MCLCYFCILASTCNFFDQLFWGKYLCKQWGQRIKSIFVNATFAFQHLHAVFLVNYFVKDIFVNIEKKDCLNWIQEVYNVYIGKIFGNCRMTWDIFMWKEENESRSEITGPFPNSGLFYSSSLGSIINFGAVNISVQCFQHQVKPGAKDGA